MPSLPTLGRLVARPRLTLSLGAALVALALASPAIADRVGILLEINALSKSAKEALADRDYPGAQRQLEELARTGEGMPEGLEALLLLGKAKLAQGDAAGALESWDRLVHRYADSSYASKAR